METKLSNYISDKDTDTINTKNCCKPFTEELGCKECLERSAENGDKVAMFNFANRYRDGEGTVKDLEKAFHWYQKAAEKDHIEAMNNLAMRYNNGEGTEKNLEKALQWYQKTAENGDRIHAAKTVPA
ncbi:unnamed protein product [Rhizophagus irregularis]|nr:unnamed protein product [Rhizophagus irregularis]